MSDDKDVPEIAASDKINDDPDDFIYNTFSIQYKKKKNNNSS